MNREAESLLNRLEQRFGPDQTIRLRLQPIVIRVLETGPPSPARTALLRLVVKAYYHHIKVRTTLDSLRAKLRDRLNEVYGDTLGIEPPGLG